MKKNILFVILIAALLLVACDGYQGGDYVPTDQEVQVTFRVVEKIRIDGMPCIATSQGGLTCDWEKFDGDLSEYKVLKLGPKLGEDR